MWWVTLHRHTRPAFPPPVGRPFADCLLSERIIFCNFAFFILLRTQIFDQTRHRQQRRYQDGHPRQWHEQLSAFMRTIRCLKMASSRWKLIDLSRIFYQHGHNLLPISGRMALWHCRPARAQAHNTVCCVFVRVGSLRGGGGGLNISKYWLIIVFVREPPFFAGRFWGALKSEILPK